MIERHHLQNIMKGIHQMSRGVISIGILVVAGYINPARGQPAATLYIELQNVVEYQVDTSDLSK